MFVRVQTSLGTAWSGYTVKFKSSFLHAGKVSSFNFILIVRFRCICRGWHKTRRNPVKLSRVLPESLEEFSMCRSVFGWLWKCLVMSGLGCIWSHTRSVMEKCVKFADAGYKWALRFPQICPPFFPITLVLLMETTNLILINLHITKIID